MYLASFLNKMIKQDGFLLIDADLNKYVIGKPKKELPISIKLLDRKLHHKLLFSPDLYFGEAYMDGSLVIENGSLTEFLDIAMKNIGRNEINKFSEIFNNNSSATCIFLSSSEVYADNITNSSHKENDKLNINLNNKRNFYILGKINGEAIVNKFRQKGFNAISTRVSLCYGPGVDLSDTRVMSEFVKKGLNNDEHINNNNI